jgi:hypothetical protein
MKSPTGQCRGLPWGRHVSGAERRQWPRIPASLLNDVTASIIAGPDVKLVNLSRGGALMEVAARYPMRSKVRLKLTRPGGGVTQVHGVVSWAKVASISNGRINYLLAVIFDSAIEDLSAATGIDDVENHAAVSMVADPFEGTEASAAALSLPTVVPSPAPAVADENASPLLVETEPAYVEEELSESLFNARGDQPPVPAPAADHEALSAAAARAEELRRELERACADLAGLSAANDNLSEQLQAYDEDRVRLRSELEAARQQWDEEKSSLAREAAETMARLHDLQDALQGHQQSGAQTLAEQQALAQTLSMRLETLEAERGALRTELASERQRWEEERAAVARDAAEAVARANALQEALERRNQESDAAIQEAQARVGELERALYQHNGSSGEALARARTREQELISRLQAFDAERAELTARVDQERRAWHDERHTMAAAAFAAQGRIGELQAAAHARREAQEHALADARARQQELQSRLDATEAERSEWTLRNEAERAAWQEERIALAAEAAAAAAAVTTLEARFREREAAHTQALAEARAQSRELQGRIQELEASQQRWLEERAGFETAAAAAAGHVRALQEALERQDHVHQLAMQEAHALQQQLEGRITRLEGDLVDWQAGRDVERAAWRDERAGLVQQMDAAGARVEALEEEVASRQDEHVRAVAEQQAAVLSLTARLEVADAERLQVQRELADERARFEQERSELAAEATARSEEFQAALEAREQIHAEAIAREQSRFEELIAELMQAANDQQAEYQQLMAERTAALEEQVSRVERAQAQLIRVRTEAELHRTSFDVRIRQLEAHLAAAEAANAVHEQRQRDICREAERLVELLAAPAVVDASDQAPLFTAATDVSAQAVA